MSKLISLFRKKENALKEKPKTVIKEEINLDDNKNDFKIKMIIFVVQDAKKEY